MKKYLYYASTLLIALFVGLVGGIVDIIQPQNVIDTASHLGYPLYFFTLLGVFKILGGIALVLPNKANRLKDMAYAGFSFDLIFAAYSHLVVGDPIIKVFIPVSLLIILGISFYIKEQWSH